VFHLCPRRAEAFIGSMFHLLWNKERRRRSRGSRRRLHLAADAGTGEIASVPSVSAKSQVCPSASSICPHGRVPPEWCRSCG
jgi:hypothetical protein